MIRTTFISMSVTFLVCAVALPALFGTPQELSFLPYLLSTMSAVSALLSMLYDDDRRAKKITPEKNGDEINETQLDYTIKKGACQDEIH